MQYKRPKHRKGDTMNSSVVLEHLNLIAWKGEDTFDALVKYYIEPLSLLCDIASEIVDNVLDTVKNKGEKVIRDYDKETIIESLNKVFWLLTEVQINLGKMQADLERTKIQYKSGEKSPYLGYAPEKRLGHLKWEGGGTFEFLALNGSFVIKFLLESALGDLAELWSSLEEYLDEKIQGATSIVNHMKNRTVDLDSLLYDLMDQCDK